jgi:outer membrane protein
MGGVALAVITTAVSTADAQTLSDTLSLAYVNNPTLNASRSTTRATDEGVAIAISGFRPQITSSASYDIRSVDTRTTGFKNKPNGKTVEAVFQTNEVTHPSTIAVNLVQPLFNGFQTVNAVKQSEASVRAQRETMRNTEQSVLLDAATAFMDVVRDSAVAGLRETAVKFFTEQVRAARDRFNVGEGTRTDVAQAEARQQQAIAQLNTARSNLTTSRAVYARIVGVEAKRLSGSFPIERSIPKSVGTGLELAQVAHPAIMAAVNNIDVASFNVKILEGELLPQLNLSGSLQRTLQPGGSTASTNTAVVGLNLTVPIYQGGQEYARIRQAKEQLGTARIQVDVVRDQVRAAVRSNWGILEASIASIAAARAEVAAQQLALSGVIEEQRVGQRTTLDVLNAQSDLTDAQITLANAERNRIVAAFALVASLGRLDAESLNLRVARYDPKEHYDQVRDKWIGTSTPDGR